jgi:hypothetical protein
MYVQASWWCYCKRPGLQLLHLIAAGDWAAAHDLFTMQVAPLLVLAAMTTAATGSPAAATEQFAGDARGFLAAVGDQVVAAAVAEAKGSNGGSSSSSSDAGCWWFSEDGDGQLLTDPAAAVAAAAFAAAVATNGWTGAAAAAARGDDDDDEDGGDDQQQEHHNWQAVAGASLQALCRVLQSVGKVLGPSWGSGVGVYSAWCSVFLDAEFQLQDPALAAASQARLVLDSDAAAAREAEAAAGAAGAAMERCLYLSDLLAGVAAAGGTNSSSSSSRWWGSPLHRLVHAKMTAEVGKALVRLGGSASGGQQRMPLLVPLAAAGFGSNTAAGFGVQGLDSGDSQGLGFGDVGGQGAMQLLAGAAADLGGGTALCR